MNIIRMVSTLLCFVVGGISMAKGESQQNTWVYPGPTWKTRTPEESGLSLAKLDALRDAAGGRGCIVRYGYMVYAWGDVAKRADVASACKPVLAHFLFKAIEEGRIGSLDDQVSKFEPRLKDLNADLGYKDRNITWRHLVNQISCYGVQERPGTAYDYNDYNFALFFDSLMLKVYGSTWETVDADILHPKLTDHLQCEDNPTFMAFGTGDRPGRLGISVRDFARFGLLYLRKGNWKGMQLILPDHVAVAVATPLPNSIPRTAGKDAEMIPGQRSGGGGKNQTDHMGSYSFMWWTNGVDRDGKRHWPDAPLDAYGAFGHGGPRAMVVLPGYDLIISWNDADIKSRDKENQVLKLLVESVVK